MTTPITIPLLNPNEPEALLAAVHVQEGQPIAKGDLLCTLETTKSTADLPAEQDGFIIGLRLAQGQTVRAGEVLCYIAADASWMPPAEAPAPLQGQAADGSSLIDSTAPVPENLRITQPALALARQMGLALEQLPQDRLVTENIVRAAPEKPAAAPDFAVPQSAFDPTAVIVYGGGGHGKSLIDLLRAMGIYRILGIVDDVLSPQEIVMGLPVLGGGEVLPKLHAQGVRLAVNAVGGIGDITVRIKIFQKLAQAGFVCPAMIHPTAFVEPSASLSPGVQVFPHAYVGSEARIGFGCIVNTGAIVSHDCVLGDYTNIAPGAMLAGNVQVGAAALVGMGVTLNLRVKVGSGARIGNSSTIKGDVPEKGVVRAGTSWP